MIVTHRLSMNLDRMEQGLQIDAVQNDSNSRYLQLELLQDGQPWTIPGGTSVTIRYSRPDGSGGQYDMLPDGEMAWSCTENYVTVMLAPQVCSVPGVVQCILELRSTRSLLHTFGVKLLVQPNPTAQELPGEDYNNVTAFLPIPQQAQVGDYIRVLEVSSTGRVIATEAVALPQSGIPMPETAAVGQCILVAAVDENGKVTQTVAGPAGEVLTDAAEVAF